MSGIIGYFSRNIHKKNITNDILNALNDTKYRIVDSFLSQTCFFGKLDVCSANIKIRTKKSEDKISIVTCGEIYNENIKDLDKIILKLYKKGDLNHLKDLNGYFAAAIYDDAKEKLTIVNDRYGIIKMFYYQDKDHFCFAPKIKPLLKLVADKSLRKDAIIDFFLFGYLLGDKTFFKNIYQIPSASILEVSKSDIKLTKYWDYKYDEEYVAKPKAELIDELGNLWQKSVERRIKKDEKIIIPLSGGLDSRAILATALECTSKENIITFTFGEKGSYDFEIGKIIAEKTGVKNIMLGIEKENFEEQYNISMIDIEGMIDATPYFAIKGYKEMKKYGEELFSGFMGGEIMGSHLSSKMMGEKINSVQDHIKAKNIIFEENKMNDFEDIKKLFNPSHMDIKNLKYSFERTLDELKQIHIEEMPNYCAIWDYKHRQNRYIPNAIFRYREYFKNVTPFLDNDLVDFMLKIPPKLRLNKKLYKSMLLKEYPELFELPTKNTFGLRLNANTVSLFLHRIISFSKTKANRIFSMLIKRNIFLEKTMNYRDYNDLLRRNKEYRGFIRRTINKVMEREYFNKEYIEKIWNLQMQGKKNFAMLFGLLVTFELFLEEFVDDQSI